MGQASFILVIPRQLAAGSVNSWLCYNGKVSEHIVKSHNKTLLLYHLVCPAKYRRKIFTTTIEASLKDICLQISQYYEVYFVEIGSDEDHVHFLIQTVPTMLPKTMVQTIKSITGRELFKRHPEIKHCLWGGHLWTAGYYLNTVGVYGNESVLRKYVQNQGNKYKQIYRAQLTLFEGLS